ncbi:YadA-like family protein [Paraburkholderia humisilvae]|uniref:Autotransporter adhesin SadA n=1 Tax=Paraburkholderia humisilvae TaxID=627669 RepID=A0A6J5F166_9BURK|nr:YadA-like family protein [Paraburkholderia humisilvae]CAB3771401.1 hypothetical protein LMG29542_06614 [Paraburkholderia humisilvae]
MNRVFVNVWSAVTQTWVAAAEIAKGRGKAQPAAAPRRANRLIASRKRRVVDTATLLLLSAMLAASSYAQAQNNWAAPGASATGSNSTAAGVGADASGASTTAIGEGSTASGTYGTALGQGASATGDYTTAVGKDATASDIYSTAIGQGAQATNNSSTAVGYFATSSGRAATSLGTSSSATGDYSTAVGQSTNVSGYEGTGVGRSARVSGTGASALGAQAAATGDYATSVGYLSAVSGSFSGAFGYWNAVDAAHSYVIGNFNVADKTQSDVFVLGNNVRQTLSNSVALGTQSVMEDGDPSQGTSHTAGLQTYPKGNLADGNDAFAGATPVGVVSVGSEGQERRVQNVAAGLVGPNSTDAINGSQLYATNVQVNKNTADIEDINTTGIKYFHANSSSTDSRATGQDSVAIGMGAVANNADDVALGAGSVTAAAVGTSGYVIGGRYYAFAGSNPSSTVSIGSAGNERTITNVAAGRISAGSTDAVNGSQLYAVSEALGDLSSTVGDVAEGSVRYDKNSDGTVNHGSITLEGNGGTVIHNVANGVQGSDAVNMDQLNSAISGISGNTSAAANPMFKAEGQRDKEAAVASGTHATAMGANAKASADNSVALGAGSVATRENTVSVGTAGNERQIVNVAPGANGTDAVNVDQLTAAKYQANQYTDQRLSGIDNAVNGVARDAYSGVAAATALSMIPDVDLGKTIAVGVGTANYRGYQAAALGATARITQNVKVRVGAGVSSGGTNVGVGASYQW